MASSNQTDKLEFQVTSLVPLSDDVSVSDDTREWFEVVFYVIICGSIAVIGSFANLINIVVFIKQGFADTANISFLALSVSDLGSLLALVWESVLLNPLFPSTGSNLYPLDVNYLTSVIPHGIFLRIAWWITTFITFERCLCVTMPLKVKGIFSPKLIVGVIVTISVITFVGMSPLIIANQIAPMFLSSWNRTLLVRMYTENGPYVEEIGFTFNIVSQFGAVVLDMTLTTIIIYQVKVKSKWREKYAYAGFTARDRKLIKMITLISFIFIVCVMPSCLNFLFELVYTPDYSLTGRNHNIYLVIWSVIITLEAVNSSVTIIVYYNMSAKFKGTFQELF